MNVPFDRFKLHYKSISEEVDDEVVLARRMLNCDLDWWWFIVENGCYLPIEDKRKKRIGNLE